jgi:3-methyladenine DNA glycosylase AlkD
MTVNEALKQLEALGSEKLRAQNAKRGAPDNQYGCQLGDIRKLAKKLKTDHQLGLELWGTGNVDAQLLGVLLLKPADLSAKDLDRMVRTTSWAWVADWFSSYVIKEHPDREALRVKWMKTRDAWAARAGWSLTALLDRIESEMAKADPLVQWTMNSTLAAIGIHHAKLRKRAIAIGEKLGIFRDYPVSKGCTSPFAPIWISEMVRRQG